MNFIKQDTKTKKPTEDQRAKIKAAKANYTALIKQNAPRAAILGAAATLFTLGVMDLQPAIAGKAR